MNDIFVYLTNLPVGVKGAVSLDNAGDYSIYINAHYNEEQRREIYNHEIRHILKNHLYIYGDVGEIELAANDKLALLDEIKKVETAGLPLHKAIERPILPDYNTVEIEVVISPCGIEYELPEGMTVEEVMRGFEAWFERVDDERERHRDMRKAANDYVWPEWL